MKRNPRVADARSVCDAVGARSVIVLAFEGDRVSGSSYGETVAECRSTGRTLDAIVAALEAGRIPAPVVR